MTRHYVMTRSSYGPEWDRAANRRRFYITKAITARLLARQTTDDWTWVVLLDERDRLLEHRLALYADSAPAFVPIVWSPGDVAQAPWDSAKSTNRVQKVAATAYKHPGWRSSVDHSGLALQTRLDDDDGLAVDALARTRAKAAEVRVGARTALMQPVGVRVWNGRETIVRHDTNAMHTLLTPPGDETTVYDYGHRLVGKKQPVVVVDERPAWLWVRHQDTISGWRKADVPISQRTRELFPIDWRVLA